jgi:uncharacterized protein YjbJ (UPF0337 family)
MRSPFLSLGAALLIRARHRIGSSVAGKIVARLRRNRATGCPFSSHVHRSRRFDMAVNSDTIQGNWQQLKGKVKEQWGKLTDDDLTYLEGKQDQLAGKIQERYGVARDEAEKQVREFRTRNNW